MKVTIDLDVIKDNILELTKKALEFTSDSICKVIDNSNNKNSGTKKKVNNGQRRSSTTVSE